MATPKPTPTKRSPWLIIAVIAATVGGSIWLWEEVLEDRFVAKRFGVVEPDLIYRSGQLSQYVVERVLADNQIQVVVDLTGPEPNAPHEHAEVSAVAKLDIERHELPLKGDGTGDITRYADAIEVMHRAYLAGQPVLVHCAAGSQRTGAAVAFYRVLVQGRDKASVIDELKQYDWSPKKDRVLLRYMDEHIAELAKMLKDRGVIDTVPEALPTMSS